MTRTQSFARDLIWLCPFPETLFLSPLQNFLEEEIFNKAEAYECLSQPLLSLLWLTRKKKKIKMPYFLQLFSSSKAQNIK